MIRAEDCVQFFDVAQIWYLGYAIDAKMFIFMTRHIEKSSQFFSIKARVFKSHIVKTQTAVQELSLHNVNV